jgi:hypothetical protein
MFYVEGFTPFPELSGRQLEPRETCVARKSVYNG